MRMVTATEANRDFSKLLEQVEGGGVVSITKRGKVVATLAPARDSLDVLEEEKSLHLAELRARKPYANVVSRGTRDELYEDQ